MLKQSKIYNVYLSVNNKCEFVCLSVQSQVTCHHLYIQSLSPCNHSNWGQASQTMSCKSALFHLFSNI